MNNPVRFLSGGINSLKNYPIVPGNIYFALSDDKTYGYIVYDFIHNNESNRIVMSTNAKTAGNVEHSLFIGDQEYDGSKEIIIPIYEGDMGLSEYQSISFSEIDDAFN